MKSTLIKSITLVLSLSLSAGLLYFWLTRPITLESMSLPGSDKVPPGARNQVANINIGEFFESYKPELVEELNNEFEGTWTNFRGLDCTNIVKDAPPLLEKFDNLEQRIKWQCTLGEGHSAPVIYKGVVYVLDYDEEKEADMLRAFSLKDGQEIWRRWYEIDIKRNHGFSRTVPAVNDEVVVTMGPKCQVMTVDRKTGDLLWSIDLIKEYGAEIPQWYTGQCPFIDKGVLVLAPGGTDTLLMGVEAKTGKVLWKTPNPDGWRMSHASVMPMDLDGQPTYVYSAIGGVVGINAKTGEILWKTAEWAPSVVAPSPIVCGENLIYLTAGYGAGGAMLQIDGKEAKIISRHKPNEGLSLEQQSAIFYQDVLYAIMPKDAGFRRMQLMGTPTDDLTNFTVTAPRDLRFGLGPFIMADDKFYVLSDNGEMTVFKVEGAECKPLDTARLIKGQDAWGPIAYADGYMVMRDSITLFCIDMRKDRK